MFFPIQGNPYFASVAALLPMDGAHNATSFPDFSPTLKTVTRTGSTIISTALGFSSAYFPSGSYLTVGSHADFAIGTGNYTLSFRCQLTAINTHIVVDFRPSASNGAYPCVIINNTGVLSFYFNADNRIVSASGAIAINTTYAITVCRSGSSTRMFINGVQVGSTYSNADSIPQSPGLLGGTTFWGASFVGGYLWDFQYVRAALYTANFTPTPSKALMVYGENKSFHKQPYTQPSFLQAARLGL